MDETVGVETIVVGAGIGGLIVGALLAREERRRVLVLEKSETIAGRLVHFRGDDLRKAEDYLAPLARIGGWLAHAEPELGKMIDARLLSGYAFDGGWHGLLGGGQSRVCRVLRRLGKEPKVVPYRGFAYWEGDTLHRLLGRAPFPWMTADEYTEVRRLAGEIYRMEPEEARAYNHVSLIDWLKQRTECEAAIHFFDITGAFLVGLNSGQEVSAGEYILTTRMVARAGLHLAAGSVGTAAEPGLGQFAADLVSIIVFHGGEVRLNHEVRRILVENGRTIGVNVSDGCRDTVSSAPTVVCNVPLQAAIAGGLLPVESLPADFVKTVTGAVSVGGICPMFGLRRPVLDIPGMYVARIAVDCPGFPGGIILGYVAHSLLVEGRAPAGKQLIEVWVGLRTDELRSLRREGRILSLCQAIQRFLEEHHDGFRDSLEWALFPVVDSVLSVAPTPEQVWERMPDVSCPGISGLYFVGDSVRNYAQYTDGVAYSALCCVSALSGRNYVEATLPEYQQ